LAPQHHQRTMAPRFYQQPVDVIEPSLQCQQA
jgi:hypothetical protein